MKWIAAVLCIVLLAGCASKPRAYLTITTIEFPVQAVLQKDAPVQIVSVTETLDNLLASVTVKNTTDRYVQDFTVTWTVFRPANCAASGTAPRMAHVMREGQEVHAEARGSGTLPPGAKWGDRVLKPHEQIEITSLSLMRTALAGMANKYNAKKLRVQVGIAYVNFTTGDKFTSHNGPPDWRDATVEQTNILDAEDAAKQACS
jgi:hypothetical protein